MPPLRRAGDKCAILVRVFASPGSRDTMLLAAAETAAMASPEGGGGGGGTGGDFGASGTLLRGCCSGEGLLEASGRFFSKSMTSRNPGMS